MPTLTRPFVRFQPEGFITTECIGCADVVSVPHGTRQPLCPSCQRAMAWGEASRLLSDVRELRDGKGVFALLTAEERNEQLSAMGLPTTDKPLRFPGFGRLTDSQLISIIAGDEYFGAEQGIAIGEALVELSYRMDRNPPSPAERAELEERDENESRIIVLDGDTQDADRWDGLA